MALKSKMFGGDKLRERLKRLPKEVKAPIRLALVAGVIDITTEAKKMIQRGTKTGKLYGRHRASAPGQAPATETGFLVANLHHKVDPDGLGASAISGADYSEFLEFGTVNISARPFFQPALDKVRKRIFSRLTKELKRANA